MTIGLVSKLLQGGCVTASACCVLNFIWEHVVQLIVAIICIIWKGKNPGTRNLAFEVSGPSMIPTFNLKGDGVIVVSEHLSSYFRTIKKGDVVILRSPEKPNNLICKRIAAMGGEFMRTDTDGKDSFENLNLLCIGLRFRKDICGFLVITPSTPRTPGTMVQFLMDSFKGGSASRYGL
ncbi:uncharacterized protein LOC113667609 isoform X2 [Pocillopora damicornis]|uniref:uncharacterized protein LOC113667609 isoform X2 n=1 Tax=Pocillopora damicornis TaxID=46731 RepID=UPI000F55323D|nr:uncharacterized protein LOC113667609 isoform X2 [Pocillopora damicornis]